MFMDEQRGLTLCLRYETRIQWHLVGPKRKLLCRDQLLILSSARCCLLYASASYWAALTQGCHSRRPCYDMK